jgi:hypothetical protein
MVKRQLQSLVFVESLDGISPKAYMSLIGIYVQPGSLPSYFPMSIFLGTFLTIWAPDIAYNHGDENPLLSDQVKDTYYHEFGHASHWNSLNDNNYWLDNIGYIVENQGYGDGTAIGYDKCATIEMWGFHIGPSYTDGKYLLQHSNFPFLNQNRARYINLLEGGGGLNCGGMPCDFRFVNNFIPRGLILDLIDDNVNDYPTPGEFEDIPVVDNVNGFTNNSIFIGLDANISSPSNLKTHLNSNLPTGINSVDIDNLFSSYGF